MNPRSRTAITAALADSYEYFVPLRYRVGHLGLREFPGEYVDGWRSGQNNGPFGKGHFLTQKLDWSSWELGRAMLDEASKNLMLTCITWQALVDDKSRATILSSAPSWKLEYVAGNLVSDLYYAHFKTCLGGMFMVGCVVTRGIFLHRDISKPTTWGPVQGTWGAVNTRHLGQSKVLREYERIQKHEVQWLQPRDAALVELKRRREEFTYQAHRVGSYLTANAPDIFAKSFLPTFEFLDAMVRELGTLLPAKPAGGEYKPRIWNPKARFDPLLKRLDELRVYAKTLGLI